MRLATLYKCGDHAGRPMGSIRCTVKQLARGIEIPLDERTTIIVGPDAAQATLLGRAFDPQKSFPLPRTLTALTDLFRFALSLSDATAALVVGHTNADDPDPSEVALERAKSLAAWLSGDTAPWLANYGEGVDEARRWGPREDRAMLKALPDLPATPAQPSAASPNAGGNSKPKDPLVVAFQKSRGLQDDGIAGPITRGQLIKEYFALSRKARVESDEGEKTSSAKDSKPAPFAPKVSAHGAAANFSLKDVADARAAAAAKDSEDSDAEETSAAKASDSNTPGATPQARIDFFFYMSDAGVDPAAGSEDGPEYLEWVALASDRRDFIAGVGSGAAGAHLALSLLDKTGLVVHRNRKMTLTGPEELEGVTDNQGDVVFDGVMPGDYTFTLTLEFFEGKDAIVDTYRGRAVVLPGEKEPQVRLIGVVPRVLMARLRGLLFDTNKAFLLPSALPDLKRIRRVYEDNNPSKLLVVGHTDTTAEPSINDPLSLERAKSTLAYLQDDVDAWLAFYGTKLPESRRWGAIEDAHMRQAVNAARGDEGANLLTRKELIAAYMQLDGIELDSGEFDIEAKAHGCGENFPVDDTGAALDQAPEDAKEDNLDRRVELFFFDTEFGVAPAAPGDVSPKGSTQYPTWRKNSEILEFGAPGTNVRLVSIKLLGANRQPLGLTAWTLTHEKGQDAGKTGADGVVLARVPSTVTSATLRHDLGEIELQIEELPPIDRVLGAQQRLVNMGYPCPTSDALDAETQAALRAFQADEGLTESGDLDAETQARLQQVYGH